MGLRERAAMGAAKKFAGIMNSEEMLKIRAEMLEKNRTELGRRGYLPDEIEEILFVMSGGKDGQDTGARAKTGD